MYAQNIGNNPRTQDRNRSGQAGMIMSGMPTRIRIGTVVRSQSTAKNTATFNPAPLAVGARIEFLFGLPSGNVPVEVPITDVIAGDMAAIVAAAIAKLRSTPQINGFATFSAITSGSPVSATFEALARFPNQLFTMAVQAIDENSRLVANFATYGAPIVPLSEKAFYESLLYPNFGLLVAAAPTPTDGVQGLKLPASASDRILGVVCRRDPIMNSHFQPEIREFMEQGDIRPWLENYVASDTDQVAYRHTADAPNNRLQLGAIVAVASGGALPAGCKLLADWFPKARFVRIKSDGTASLALS